MRTRANGAVAPVSPKELKAHQHRELRSLRLLASEAACNVDAVHEMESLLEYALAARTEHRSDGGTQYGTPSRLRLGY